MRPMCAGLLLVAMLFPASVSAQEDTLRVFFLGRSEFGASGGIPAPFEEVCELAGMRCRAHRHWDFIEHDRRNALPIRPAAVARDRHVLRILATEEFDAVFYSFFAYNTEFFESGSEYTADALAGYEALYRLITVSGARPYINIGYATQGNPGDTARIAHGATLLMARLDSVATAARTRPPIRVPGGEFFNDMARQLGETRWFADPLHASTLGQYAMARFFFSCITGRDPTTFAHRDHIDPQDAHHIDAGIVRHLQGCGAQRRPSWNRGPAPSDRVRVFVRGDDFGYTDPPIGRSSEPHGRECCGRPVYS